MSRANDYDELLEHVTDGIASGQLAEVKRLLVRHLSQATTADERGAALGFEVACLVEEDAGVAGQRLRELVAAEPADERLLGALACSLSDVGQARDNTRCLELAESVFAAGAPPDASWMFTANHAVVLERLERWEEAAARFEQAAALAPDEHQLHLRRAECFKELDRLDEARDAYVAYLRGCPDDAHQWISLAIVECDAGRYEDAERAYWRAGGLEPNNMSLHYNWLITARRAGKMDLVTDVSRRLQAIDEEDWRSRLATAALLELDGDMRRAYRHAAETFHRELAGADADEEGPREHLDHIAGWATRVARSLPRADSQELIATLCVKWILPADVLFNIASLESPELEELSDYQVLLEALSDETVDDERGGDSGDGGPFAYITNHRVYAADAEQAAAMALVFERRCGARDARVLEVELMEDARALRHRGPWWRDRRVRSFPPAEFGQD